MRGVGVLNFYLLYGVSIFGENLFSKFMKLFDDASIFFPLIGIF